MIDQRFHRRAGPFSLARIAEYVGGTLSCPDAGALTVDDIAVPEEASERDISVFGDPTLQAVCMSSRALALITSRKLAEGMNGHTLVLVEDPRKAMAQIGQLFYPPEAPAPGIDPRAYVDETAKIGEGCRIEAGAAIGAGAEIGARCRIAHNAVIDERVILGEDCDIGPNCTISHALLGTRVRLKAGTTVGGEGFGFAATAQGLARLRQLGRVLIEDDVEIGNNCTVDRGCLTDTKIGRGTKIDNLVHIAHNVRIGAHCVITGQTGIAGSAELGDGVIVGGQTAIVDHVRIGAGARIVGQSGVMRDVGARETVAGTPAVPIRDWHRQTIALAKLIGRKKVRD